MSDGPNTIDHLEFRHMFAIISAINIENAAKLGNIR